MLKPWPAEFCVSGAKTIRKQENKRPSKEAQISNRNFQRMRVIHSLLIFLFILFFYLWLKNSSNIKWYKEESKNSFQYFTAQRQWPSAFWLFFPDLFLCLNTCRFIYISLCKNIWIESYYIYYFIIFTYACMYVYTHMYT